MKKQRLVVGISGGSGAVLGIRLLQALQPGSIETHLIITPTAHLTIEEETGWKTADVAALADFHYNNRDLGASVASGSFETLGMVVIPCSIKSLSAIANSYSADLLSRAADVTLKEGRQLLLVVREAPLHAGHVRLMDLATKAGAVLFPPVPAFYTHPQSVDEIVDNIVGRVLSRMGIDNELYLKWQGTRPRATDSPDATENKTISQDRPDIGEPLWSLPAMTIATTGSDGTPHASTVYFAAGRDHTLYFFSAGDSLHSQHIGQNSRAAAAIHPLVEGWQEIHGLQVRGKVMPVQPGEDWEVGWQIYRSKFPFVDELSDVIKRNTLYAFHLDWIRMVDNRQGFGYREEWNREP